MESIDETSRNISSKMGFFKHVFNFDDNSKSEMLNIMQLFQGWHRINKSFYST